MKLSENTVTCIDSDGKHLRALYKFLNASAEAQYLVLQNQNRRLMLWVSIYFWNVAFSWLLGITVRSYLCYWVHTLWSVFGVTIVTQTLETCWSTIKWLNLVLYWNALMWVMSLYIYRKLIFYLCSKKGVFTSCNDSISFLTSTTCNERNR